MNVSRRDAKALADSIRIAELAFVTSALPVLFAHAGIGDVETDHDRAFGSFATDAALFADDDATRRVACGQTRDLDAFAWLEIHDDHGQRVERSSKWPS